ncbi:transcriptional repressor [Nonomuraea sp. NPDC049625]|uniref:Fur family transcriptional regulator n=1 Tax=Nonomuraea sp. NPDC049625 TaxID=3155775 RepID=UPI003419B612
MALAKKNGKLQCQRLFLGSSTPVFEDHGETTYRLFGPNHRHHLVCQSCGTVIEGPPVPELRRWLRRLDTEHGFQAERHHFEVYGTCGTCRLAGEPGNIAPPTQ